MLFEKLLHELSDLQAWFQYISIVLNLAYNEAKLYKTLHSWSRYMLNFDFLEKGLEIDSPPHFVYDFKREMCLILYSINWPNFIASLPLLDEILRVLQLFINQVVTS